MLLSLLAALARELALSAAAFRGLDLLRGISARQDREFGSLSVHLVPQINEDSPVILSVLATLINTGDTTLRVIADPDGLLSTLGAHVFDFYPAFLQNVTLTNAVPVVNAIQSNYDRDVTVALSDPAGYVMLRPGDNTTVVHNLSDMYAFGTPGQYMIEMASGVEYLRTVANDNRTAQYIKIDANTSPISRRTVPLHLSESVVRLLSSGTINNTAASDPCGSQRPLSKRCSFNSCSALQTAILLAAVRNSQAYIAHSNRHLAGRNSHRSRRYTTWFGRPHNGRWTQVRRRYYYIDRQPEKFKYNCACKHPTSLAYVEPKQPGTVNLCPMYWKKPATGVNSQAGTIIHEATRFRHLGNTREYAKGTRESFNLAQKSPDHAIWNANSYEYFAEFTNLQ